MNTKIYIYAKCSTCQKALKFLDKKKIPYQAIPIVETPPSVNELKKMSAYYDHDFKKLFNTSGLVYREMKLGTKLPTMSEKEAIALLSQNGKLIKRPFLLIGDAKGLVGFKESEWMALK